MAKDSHKAIPRKPLKAVARGTAVALMSPWKRCPALGFMARLQKVIQSRRTEVQRRR
jgi:hypothetical protein